MLIPGTYHLLQASLSRSWLGMNWTLRARNIADERYIQWASWGDMALIAEPRSFEIEVYYRL